MIAVHLCLALHMVRHMVHNLDRRFGVQHQHTIFLVSICTTHSHCECSRQYVLQPPVGATAPVCLM
jgi:hypothetical protein